MADTKTKKPAKRKAANSPAPCGPGSTCGHSGCEGTCKVRYVGPTSHPRDHHAQEAAQGTRHVWTAAIVAGLAVVLTGTIAYSAVEAGTTTSRNSDLTSIARRLDRIESQLSSLGEQKAAAENCGDAALNAKQPAAAAE